MRRVCLGRQDPNCTADYHGTASAYRHADCTCPHAVEDHRLYSKRLREGRNEPVCVDPTVTRRQMRALAAIGWPLIEQARRIGWDGAPSRLMSGPSKVTREVADRVAALYAEIKEVPGPSARSRIGAARKGWPTPDDWAAGGDINNPTSEVQRVPDAADEMGIDLVAVERALTGEAVRLTDAERHHAVLVGCERGMSINRIAVALGMSGPRARKLAETPLPDGYELVA